MLDRREFLGTVGGGIVVLLVPEGAAAQQRDAAHNPFPPELDAWLNRWHALHVDANPLEGDKTHRFAG